MFQDADIDLAGFQQLDAQVAADQNFKPSRQKVSDALASLLDQAEIHRLNAVRNSLTPDDDVINYPPKPQEKADFEGLSGQGTG